MFSAIKVRLLILARLHYYAFFKHLDPVQSSPKGLPPQIRTHYWLALLFFITVLLHGVFGLPYLETGHLPLSLDALASSPALFTHQLTSPSLRSAYDALNASNTALTLATFLVLLVKSGSPPAGRLHPNGTRLSTGTRLLSQSVSKQILSASQLGQRTVRYVILSYALVIYIFSYLNLLTNGTSPLSLGSLLFWTVEFPTHFAYIIYAFSAPPFIVMMVSWYLDLQLKEADSQLGKLNGNLIRKRSRRGPLSLQTLLEQHKTLNRTVVCLARETVAYSSYFAPFLSTVCAYLIFGQCYLLKLFFFPTSVRLTFRETYAFGLCYLQFASSLCALIYACARVVRGFEVILEQNERFYWNLIKGRQWGRLSLRGKLTLEGRQACRQFRSAAFKLAGINYRLTSKAYFAMFSYISVIFMYVYKN